MLKVGLHLKVLRESQSLVALNTGVGFYHLTKEVRRVLATIMKIDSDNYPETLFHTCIINAPTAFRAIWAVIKPMLNKRTQGKIEVNSEQSGGN